MLSENLTALVSAFLSDSNGASVGIGNISRLGGGCINECFRMHTTVGVFFLKYNDAKRYPGMFEAEAMGLEVLRGRGGDGEARPRVPRVIGFGGDDRYSFLLLEYLESGGMRKDFWEDFGSRLAALHRSTSDAFGLDIPNYIGSLPQSNRPFDNWIDFFVEERLEAQLKLARDSGRADRELGKWFQCLYPHLPDLFPEEPPALLHGDLWSGNYMVDPDGCAAIVDPAVYYGHRYMDLGMSKLFGGFAPAFYRAYEDAYPMEKGWKKGIEVANLYPLMVHVNLFGGGYLGSVQEILRQYRK